MPPLTSRATSNETDRHVGRRQPLPAALAGLFVIALCASVPDFGAIRVGVAPAAEPISPGNAAQLSRGGRLYDNHWVVIRRAPPPGRFPKFPKGTRIETPSTWRCVSCHGWDYRGSAGQLGRVSGGAFRGVMAMAGRDPAGIAKILRAPFHEPLTELMPDEDVNALALFLASGQHDMSRLVDDSGMATGNPLRGKDIYEGACIRCHQADGNASLYGESGDKSSLGWIARHRPAQAVHKIRNGVTGADMLALRFLDVERIADLLAYLQTLDER